ncbi:MAG: metallophosphoesterase N-terminal domain-containing protein, partial [Dehalococcoidia bacterium]
MKRGIVGWIASALLIVPLILGLACTAPTQFEGAVFEDRNDNGIRDNGEPGIPDILVSNGITVTVTDETGAYNLPTEGQFVFLTTPSGY